MLLSYGLEHLSSSLVSADMGEWCVHVSTQMFSLK